MRILFLVIGFFGLFEGYWLHQNKPLEQSIADGQEIYQDFCIQCHLNTGEGVSGVFPPLAKSDFLVNNIEISIKGLKYGMSGPIVVNGEEYDGVMEEQGLGDDEIADVLNYILNSWGNQYNEIITLEQVASVKK